MASSPADTPYSVSGAAVLGVLAHARSTGTDLGPVVRRLGLDPRTLEHVDTRVPQASYNALLEEAAQRSGDDAFGLHMAAQFQADAFGVVGHLASRCNTFGEALREVARYSALVHDAGAVEVNVTGSRWTIHPGCHGLSHDVPRHVAEFSAATIVVAGRLFTGADVRPRQVTFRHARPAAVEVHQELFGVTPLFSQPHTAVVLDARVAALPLPGAQAGLRSILETFAKGLLEKLARPDDVRARVDQAVALRLEHGAPTLAAVARALGVSARTLQRQLNAAESSFEQRVDHVRQQAAKRYVEDGKLTLQQVAFLLGFKDPSNFHRAFKRWFGVTPAGMRRRA